ncbi:MAG: hypothetical protein JNM63_10975, partial [Spirochaetia bacterium]|nr:hypothetical protein [Spirochaetia bacterium]
VSNWQKQGDAWCPNKPETYALFFDLVEELIAATSCRRIHIGHDEIQGMRLCEACRGVPADELFAGDVNKITSWLAKKNVGTMLWGDFLLEYARWVPLGVSSANSANSQFRNLVVHPAVGKIDKSVVICDWHYESSRGYPTFNYFAESGYPVVGCPWLLPRNNIEIAKAIGAIHQLGVLDTDWGFLVSRAPGAASILGVTHGWNLAQADAENLKWDADAVLAASLLPIDRPSRRFDAKQIPIDLSASANLPLSGDDTAWFGLGSRHDLSWLPTGEQNFFGSRFAIGPRAVVVAHQESARTVSLKRKVKSLIFLHAVHAEDHAVGPKNFATYRVVRADGSATDLTVNNRNAAHWLSKAARRNPWIPWNYAHTWDGLLAWEGMTRFGELVNLQAWEWVNPRPDEVITSIEVKINGDAAGIKLGLVGLTAVE